MTTISHADVLDNIESIFANSVSMGSTLPCCHAYLVSHHGHLRLHVASLTNIAGVPRRGPSPCIDANTSETLHVRRVIVSSRFSMRKGLVHPLELVISLN